VADRVGRSGHDLSGGAPGCADIHTSTVMNGHAIVQVASVVVAARKTTKEMRKRTSLARTRRNIEKSVG